MSLFRNQQVRLLSLATISDRWSRVLLSGVRLIHVNTHWVWPFVLIGIGIAFLLELVYAHLAHCNMVQPLGGFPPRSSC